MVKTKFKSNKKVRANSTSTISDDNKCPNCDKSVLDEKSLQCDSCGQFTHLTCDKSITNKLYDALSESADNSLIYLCVLCKPSLDGCKGVDAANKKLDALSMAMVNQSAKLESIVNAQNVKIAEMSASFSDQNERFQRLSQHITGIESTLESNKNSLAELNMKHQPSSSHPRPWNDVASRLQDQILQPNENVSGPDSADPKQCLVIYGIPRAYDPSAVIKQFCGDLCINKRWITNVVPLRQSGPSPPIKVCCVNSEVKWNMLKGVNSLKMRGTYAKPYLSKEELQQDRALAKKVSDLRKDHNGREFKIHRGRVVEVIDDFLVDV